MRDSELQDFPFRLRGEQPILACFRRQFQLKKNRLVRHATTPKYLEEKHFWTEGSGERAKEPGKCPSGPGSPDCCCFGDLAAAGDATGRQMTKTISKRQVR